MLLKLSLPLVLGSLPTAKQTLQQAAKHAIHHLQPVAEVLHQLDGYLLTTNPPPQILVNIISSLCGADNDIKFLQIGRKTGFDINATWFNTNMLPPQGWQDFPVKKCFKQLLL